MYWGPYLGLASHNWICVTNLGIRSLAPRQFPNSPNRSSGWTLPGLFSSPKMPTSSSSLAWISPLFPSPTEIPSEKIKVNLGWWGNWVQERYMSWGRRIAWAAPWVQNQPDPVSNKQKKEVCPLAVWIPATTATIRTYFTPATWVQSFLSVCGSSSLGKGWTLLSICAPSPALCVHSSIHQLSRWRSTHPSLHLVPPLFQLRNISVAPT